MSDRFARRIYLALAEGRDLSADEASHLAACGTCQAAADRARDFEHAMDRELTGLRAPMPADPFAVSESSRRSGAFVPGLIIALTVLVASLVGVGLLAAPDPDPSPEPSVEPTASAPTPTPTPSPSPTPDLTPSPPPSASPEPTADEAVQPGDYTVVKQGEFPLYDAPNGTSFTAALPGSDLYVIAVSDGWAEVQAQQQEHSFGYVFGWVPVDMLDPRTPTQCLAVEPGMHVWFGNIAHPQRDLECYGSSGQLVARGYAIDRSEDPPGPYRGDPSWLAGRPTLELAAAIGPAVTTIVSFVYLPPDLEGTIPTSDRDGFEGTLLEVTGHFADPRSSGCTLTPVADGYPPVSAANAELFCQQRFVVDAVEIVEPEN